MTQISNQIPKHVAFIMDGNRRWAKKHNHQLITAYKKGLETARDMVNAAIEFNISHITLYAFSSENWNRPKAEVVLILELLANYLAKVLDFLHEHQIKLNVIGNTSQLPEKIRLLIDKNVTATKNYNQLNLNLAISYGGRAEIVYACKRAIENRMQYTKDKATKDQEITVKSFGEFLYNKDMPDVDLLIRTSGVHRISNFLLWHIHYAEIYFSDILWPDFNKDHFMEAISDYSQRKRNFGVHAHD